MGHTKLVILIFFSFFIIQCAKNNSTSNQSESKGGNTSASATNLQEKGVDEADYTKIGKSHFFVQTSDGVDVVDKNTLSYLGRIETDSTLTPGGLFVHENYLVRLSSGNNSHIDFYSTEEGKMPTLLKSLNLNGYVKDSRIINHDLVLILASNDYYEGPYQKMDGDKVEDVYCSDIAVPEIENTDSQLIKVAVVDLESSELTTSYSAVLSMSDDVYVTEKSIYLVKITQDRSYLESGTVITKLKVINHKPEIVASGLVEGRVKDKWAFKESDKNETLLVATTCGFTWGGSAANHLWSLQESDKQMKIVGSVEDYGKGEDIRAIRYVNDTAYIVTFKKTDPLFAFDVSDPVNPKRLGELKVPGFSTYLHPISKNRLIGIGFDALDQGNFALFQGIQVSLFDVSNPLEMSRMDNVVLGGRGSSSEITSDHHAFFYDENSRLLGVPIIETEAVANGDWSYGKPQFSGARIYDVQDHSLREAGNITHKKWIEAACPEAIPTYGQWWQSNARSPDISRLYQVDSDLIAISQYGISKHPINEVSKFSNQLSFPHRSCEKKLGLPLAND